MKLKLCSLIYSTEYNQDSFLSLGEQRPRFLTHFGGRYTYLDFLLSTTYLAGSDRHLIITKKYAEMTHTYMEHAWTDVDWHILPFFSDNEVFDKRMLMALKVELKNWVFFGCADNPFYFDAKDLVNAVKMRSKLLVPLINGKPGPCLLVEKNYLIDSLAEYLKMNMPAKLVLNECFKKLSKHKKAKAVNVSGYLRVINSIDRYITANFDILNMKGFFETVFKKVPLQSGVGEKGQGFIAEGSDFIDSFISDRVQVRGKVIRSILFPGVSIGKNSVVEDSIILPNVTIANNVKITKSFIGYSGVLPQNVRANIGDHSIIGNNKNTTSNKDYPSLFSRGYTYISDNSIIPNGTVIGSNCYIGSNVAKVNFRKLKKIADGRNVISNKKKAKNSQTGKASL